jgi:hypothetical protein
MGKDRESERREGITDADDTGLVAGEELITEAETMLPLLSLPHAHLHAALPPGHAAHATIDDLKKHVERPAPDRNAIEQHVNRLRAVPELEAAVTNWWENPTTQRFISNLNQIGL